MPSACWRSPCARARPSRACPSTGFPFSIPYDGPAAGSAPAELAAPQAPADRAVTINGERFQPAGGGRSIRFWGTNLTFGAALPPHDVADRMARRLATLGIDCVRFHHMDMAGFPRGLWDKPGAWGDYKHGALSAEALDRLDYLIAQLKKNGVYADLNLHVSRSFSPQDGFPAVGPGESVPKYGKGIDNFFPLAISEQKRYAKMLLAHVNAYTGNAYAVEPAVAIVEISNEDGLLRQWQGGGLDNLPKPYVDELTRQWNAWLRAHYADTAALRKAWSAGEVTGGGPDQLADVKPYLQTVEPARATMTPITTPDGAPAWRIQVQQASPTSWHVQQHWTPVAVRKGVAYSLTLRLRAPKPVTVSVGCAMNHEPWGNLGLSQTVSVGPQWTEHTFLFAATQDDAPENGRGGARITVGNLSQPGMEVEVTRPVLVEASVRGLLPGEGLDQGVGLPPRGKLGGRTLPVRMDLIRFLRDTEVAYWKGMCDYLHKDLGVEAQVTGTAVGYTTPYIAAETVGLRRLARLLGAPALPRPAVGPEQLADPGHAHGGRPRALDHRRAGRPPRLRPALHGHRVQRAGAEPLRRRGVPAAGRLRLLPGVGRPLPVLLRQRRRLGDRPLRRLLRDGRRPGQAGPHAGLLGHAAQPAAVSSRCRTRRADGPGRAAVARCWRSGPGAGQCLCGRRRCGRLAVRRSWAWWRGRTPATSRRPSATSRPGPSTRTATAACATPARAWPA